MRKPIVVADLDKVAVNNDERAGRATKADGKIDWEIMFDGNLILTLDKAMVGAIKKLNELADQDYEIWYLTSRQHDKCDSATREFLAREGYPMPQNVICRPAFHKTTVYKAREIARLHAERGPVVLYVDDSASNREAVSALKIEGLEIRESF